MALQLSLQVSDVEQCTLKLALGGLLPSFGCGPCYRINPLSFLRIHQLIRKVVDTGSRLEKAGHDPASQCVRLFTGVVGVHSKRLFSLYVCGMTFPDTWESGVLLHVTLHGHFNEHWVARVVAVDDAPLSRLGSAVGQQASLVGRDAQPISQFSIAKLLEFLRCLATHVPFPAIEVICTSFA